ncbi:MAG TPA: hypothetical protein VMU61_16985 [Candidatus Aquilonibacter sp.]|nr:hypothetical protein [Candidatus Aquilonibacter sp.]
MRSNKSCVLICIATLAALLTLSSCSVDVKKEANGEDKQVDIKTPAGGIHVSEQADASDVGLALYPGAQLKPKEHDDDSKSANVNISGFGFGIKVVALEYQSDAAPAKIVSFYKDQLKKYGKVLECRTNDFDVDTDIHDSDSDKSDQLVCQQSSGSKIELKVGKKDDQHIVEVEPEGKGSNFSLVYVRTHGRHADI